MISPTLACLDYLNIGEQIAAMDHAKVDFYHIDIMDGHYVPNLCLNFDMLRQIRAVSKTPMDVHLMVTNPMSYLDALVKLKVEYACCHPDASGDTAQFLKALKENGIGAGLALSPQDDISCLEPYLEQLDYVLLLFVRPGFAGQAFKPEVLEKLRQLDALRKEKGLRFWVQADGGIGWDNVGQVVEAGADSIVAGVFAVFGQPQGLGPACVGFKRLTERE